MICKITRFLSFFVIFGGAATAPLRFASGEATSTTATSTTATNTTATNTTATNTTATNTTATNTVATNTVATEAVTGTATKALTEAAAQAASGAAAPTEPEILKKARQLQAAGKLSEAYEALAAALPGEKAVEHRALLLFALGDIAFRLENFAAARAHFEQLLKLGSRLEDYSRLQLGKIFHQLKQYRAARQHFEAVLNSKATRPMLFQARKELAEIALEERQFSKARLHLKYLQKKRKFTMDYPEVLYGLVRVERARGRKTAACKWARELYSKYPAHPLLKDWTMDLAKARVDGAALGCSVSAKNKQARIKRLQWAGEADRAMAELKSLQANASLDAYAFDMLMANHLLNQGATDEALQLLVKHYDNHNRNVEYLMQLGRAASRAGENQTAVGAYYKAYEIAPRGRSAKTALFQAAFMSYQFQDYDGASRKFTQFMKAFPRSGLSRDSGWHLAWIRYLKGDYQGAYTSLAKLSSPPKKRRRRGRGVRVGAANLNRIRYWMAMSLLKMGRIDEAKPVFEALARDPAFGYYSIVAVYRLKSLQQPAPAAPEPKSPQPVLADGRDPAAAEVSQAGEGLAASEESESEEALSESLENENADGAEGAEAVTSLEDEAVAGGDDETAIAHGGVIEEKRLGVGFDDPYLSHRFERARDLAAVGRIDFARQELIEIERRTRSSADRRKLMAEYQAVESFYRSSYISEIGFSEERLRGGITGARQLWLYAYPRAFEKAVVSNSRSFNVPRELVWGIMRAESHYRQEAQSPVGAMGLMQLMPFTAGKVADLLKIQSFEVRSLAEPERNIRLGARYLQRLSEKFSGSVPLVAAGYNAGPHRVQSWLHSFGLLDMDEFIEHVPFIETRNYVKKVVRNFQIYRLLYSGSSGNSGGSGKNGSRGVSGLSWLVKPVGVKPSDSSRDVW